MKCEVFPGDRKCKHCLRRGVDCILKRVVVEADDPGAAGKLRPEPAERYE